MICLNGTKMSFADRQKMLCGAAADLLSACLSKQNDQLWMSHVVFCGNAAQFSIINSPLSTYFRMQTFFRIRCTSKEIRLLFGSSLKTCPWVTTGLGVACIMVDSARFRLFSLIAGLQGQALHPQQAAALKAIRWQWLLSDEVTLLS